MMMMMMIVIMLDRTNVDGSSHRGHWNLSSSVTLLSSAVGGYVLVLYYGVAHRIKIPSTRISNIVKVLASSAALRIRIRNFARAQNILIKDDF
jgi:uncharacterized integral membrane protein